MTVVSSVLLRVGDQRVVGGLEEREVVEAAERRVLAPDRVQPGDERQQLAVERPLLELVLLRVEVLLAARRRPALASRFSKPE